MERPIFDGADGQGIPMSRPAKVVGELPTAADQAAAFASALSTLGKQLGLKLVNEIRLGTPIHLAFGLSRQQAKQHELAQALLSRGDDVSLDLCPEYC